MRSTHFYLIDCRAGRLMFEAGWIGQMGTLLSRLRAYGVAPAEIKYVMYSHNHMDHADLVQEVKQTCGARLLIHEAQIPHLQWLEAFHARRGEPYVPIRVDATDLVVRGPHPRIPEAVGLGGFVALTPGHSPDHIALVLDDGKAFTGDLPAPEFADAGDLPAIVESWRTLLALGATSFLPAHGAPFDAASVEPHVRRPA